MSHSVLPALRPPRLRSLATGVLVALALPVAGCGSSGGGSGDADPAGVVPATAAFYGEATIRPHGAMEANVRALAEKIAQTSDPGAAIVRQIDAGLKQDRMTFKDDIDPWLGDKLAVAVTGLRDPQHPDYAIVVDAKDTKQALATFGHGKQGVAERKYRDVTYRYDPKDRQAAAGVGDTLVIATEPALKAVIDVDKGGDSLASSEKLKQARKSVTARRVGFLYADPAALIDLAASSSAAFGAQAGQLKSLLGGAGATGIGAAVVAEADAIRVESAVAGKVPSGGAAAADAAAQSLAALPGDAVAAVGLGDIGASAGKGVAQLGQLGGVPAALLSQFRVITGLDLQQDVLSWMGKGGVFVRAKGAGDVGGALVVDTRDEAKSAAFIATVQRLIRRFGAAGGVTLERFSGAGATGFALTVPRLPFPVIVATGRGKFVVAVGKRSVAEALKPTSTLADSAQFKATAARLGAKPALYVDLASIVAFAGAASGNGASYAKAQRYLQAFTGLAAGSRRTGDTTTSALVIGVK